MSYEVDTSPIAVLVVEDDELVQVIVNEILVDAGFRVVEADDARTALQFLESNLGVQVVFTDWNMPGMIDGLELARIVRKRWPTIGIIVTSGKMRPAPDGFPAGVRFISKPYRSSALVEEIKAALQGSTGQGAPIMPEGIAMQTPVTAEVGGMGIAAAASEADMS